MPPIISIIATRAKTVTAAVVPSSFAFPARARSAGSLYCSTGSSCCGGPLHVLASIRMLKFSNSASRQLIFKEARLASPACLERRRSRTGRALPGQSVARLAIARTAAPVHLTIMSTGSEKLDFSITTAESTISNFLIDNFGALIVRRPPQQLVYHDARRAAKADCTSSIELPVSSNSNRHIPELESGLSHRKQRTGPRSNRHKFAFCNSCPVAASRVLDESSFDFRLSTLDSRLPSLIANATHSREESSDCKQSTYKILIANEFHCYFNPREAFSSASYASPASLAASVSLPPLSLSSQARP